MLLCVCVGVCGEVCGGCVISDELGLSGVNDEVFEEEY